MIDKTRAFESVSPERSKASREGVEVARESVYERVTERIIETLEKGSVPWALPWAVSLPFNAVSRRPYSGVNVLLLWHTASEREYKSSAWLTYKQAEELGGHIRKGEKSTLVVYGSSYHKKVETESGEEIEEKRNFLKQYRLFNVEQAEGLPAEFYEVKGAEPFEDRQEEVEAYIQSLGATVKHGGVRATYNRREDIIKLAALRSLQGRARLLLHEPPRARPLDGPRISLESAVRAEIWRPSLCLRGACRRTDERFRRRQARHQG